MLRKLQRNIRHRWIGGVCSGLARFIGLDIFPVRILIRFLFVAFLPFLWWIYLLLWLILPKQRLYDIDDLYRERRAESVKLKPVYRPQVRVEIKRLEFDNVVDMTRGRVSDQVFAKVKSIDEAVRSLLPQFGWWRTLTNSDLATVKRAALEYFPQALQHYLSLPRDYAEHHRLASGQTPEQKLLVELTMLENTLRGVLESTYNNDKLQVPTDLKNLSERIPAHDTSSEDIQRTLEALVNRIRGKVEEPIFAKVMSIRTSVLAVLPQLSELGAGLTHEAYNVRQTALEYLPDALDKYLSLPEGFAHSHKLSNGKTAKETLLEQLELLDQTMKDIVGDVYQEDANALLVHGRFLKEKFADQRFMLPSNGNSEHLKVPEMRLSAVEKVQVK
jgi:phage shock protein PspC (stress-responsive transcriptional regulator)